MSNETKQMQCRVCGKTTGHTNGGKQQLPSGTVQLWNCPDCLRKERAIVKKMEARYG